MFTKAGSDGLSKASQVSVTHSHQVMSSAIDDSCWHTSQAKAIPGWMTHLPFIQCLSLLPGNVKAKCSWSGIPTEKPSWSFESSVLWIAQLSQQVSRSKARDVLIKSPHFLSSPPPALHHTFLWGMGALKKIIVLLGNLCPCDINSPM